jgi:hypothetical protein
LKYHLVIQAQGIPLAPTPMGENRHEIMQLLPLVEAIPPFVTSGAIRYQSPAMVQADRGCDHDSTDVRHMPLALPRKSSVVESHIGVASAHGSSNASLSYTRIRENHQVRHLLPTGSKFILLWLSE